MQEKCRRIKNAASFMKNRILKLDLQNRAYLKNVEMKKLTRGINLKEGFQDKINNLISGP